MGGSSVFSPESGGVLDFNIQITYACKTGDYQEVGRNKEDMTKNEVSLVSSSRVEKHNLRALLGFCADQR